MRVAVKHSGEVVASVPCHATEEAVRRFVASQSEWIAQAVRSQRGRPRYRPEHFESGARVYFLGEPYRVEIAHAVWKSVSLSPGALRIALARHTDEAAVRQLAEAWLAAQARQILPARFEACLPRFAPLIHNPSVPVSAETLRLTVRAMRTRWGSCSRTGHVSLNAELIHHPPGLIEYVVAHELCHLAHLNHSPAFYEELERCVPDWLKRRKALRTCSWILV